MKNIVFFLRRMQRQKFISVLAIGSLSIGIAVMLLIGLWVLEEFSFDRFHKNGEHIYLVTGNSPEFNDGSQTFRQLGDNVVNSIPEVKSVCRTGWADLDYRVDNVLKQGIRTVQVENNFFRFFSFPLIYGDAGACLDAPGKMVISESIAKKWFPGKEPIGQQVIGGGMSWQVAGVMKDVPYTSTIQADVFIPFYGRYADPNCSGDIFTTFVYAPEITHTAELEQRLTEYYRQANDVVKEMGVQAKLVPLKDIHFGDMGSGDKSLVMILAGTACAIFVIACINFINLFIATSFLRVREIGVRKTFGIGKRGLVREFFKETFVYVLIAGIVALVLAVLFLPLFNRLANYQLSIDFDQPFLYIYLFGVMVFTFLMAGAYPAFYMTRFGVVETMGQFRGKKLSFLQNALLTLQFTVSIAFLIMIFFVNKQVNYLIDYDLGYDKENIVFTSFESEIYPHYDAVRNELLKNPGIKEVSLRNSLPFEWSDGFPIVKPGSNELIQFEICQVKPNLIDMLGMKLVEGENPFYNIQQRNSIVIDELAVKRLDLKDPIGANVKIWGQNFIVKGVIQTTKNKSFKGGNNYPVVYMPIVENMVHIFSFFLMCKVEGNPQEAIRAMEEQWTRYMGDIPFTYHFLDNAYQRLYESDLRLGNIFVCAMSVMMLLSLCGLFAIAHYKVQRQIKEVGIRKVNGAGVYDLLVLLNTGFIRLVLFSFLIAGVIAYYFASYWLEGFEVRTPLSWWVFALAGIVALVVTLITVCYLTLKTIRMNPVEALKSE